MVWMQGQTLGDSYAKVDPQVWKRLKEEEEEEEEML
jgi:hypothetical protein